MKMQYRQLPQKQNSRELFVLILFCSGGAGHNIANLSFKLRQIIEFPSMLAHARASAQCLYKFNAATSILKNIYTLLQI